MFSGTTVKLVAVAVIAAVTSRTAASQATPQAPGDSAPAAKPAPVTPAGLDFSGIIFANYQYRAESAARDANKFDVERAYLTFRVPAGDRTSVRITTDLFQQTTAGNDAFYRGWALRAKYAYLQYNYLAGPEWKAYGRIGLLQTVFIEHDESFWPRWIANSPTERAGFFASADAGISTSLSLPSKAGELYATVTNGPGYTSRETDRFKDFAARVTLTPWARLAASPLQSVALTGWGYKGAIASRFVNGGTGQIGTIGDALRRDRWGVHAGSATRPLTIAVQYASRVDEGEGGSNTVASPRAVVDSTGAVASAYALVRPFMLAGSSRLNPLSLLGRFDRVTTNTETDDAYNFVIAGVVWDFSSRASVSFDYQESLSVRGSPIQAAKTWFAHFVARF